ncbi:MAG: endolytic transglycosylase MltG, partial [Bauldia sp.]
MADVRGEPYRDDAESLSARLASSLGRSSPRSPSEALRPELVPPPPTRSRAVRHPLVVFLNFVLTMVILGVLAAGGAVFATKVQFEHAGRLDEARSVNIDRGAGLGTIADRLLQEGVISSKWLFMAGVWLDRQQASLKAGEYLIPAHASMRDIMDALVSGRAILYSITIPEGLTSQQIVDCLMADTALSGDRTGGLTERQIEGCRRAAAILTGAISEVPPEGGLLPETYPFGRGDTRQGLIDRMRRDRDRVVADIWSRRAPDLPLSTPAELAVLASIVEKETSLADERSRVAAVFINRLNLNRRLES